MHWDDAIEEAKRAMTICNACRYCEGFCAVFPAMELRRSFSSSDLMYLSNLCHNCRACYYACQYAPPHQFMLNVPRAMAELRTLTYREMAIPKALGRIMERSPLAICTAVFSATLLSILLVLELVPRERLLSSWKGEGAFYQIIPYPAMVIPFCILSLWIFITLGVSFLRFWRLIGEDLKTLFSLRAQTVAIGDVALLKYLGGGGHGCNYPEEGFSHIRRWLHQLVFYGFILCLLSTTTAAIYDHLLHWKAPYPFFSWPVLLGTLGGAGIVVGSSGLMLLKRKMDPMPSDPKGLKTDMTFLAILLLVSATGLFLLWLRETRAMGILLALHVGMAGGFLLSVPFGKMVHAVYRYLALVKNGREQIQSPAEDEKHI